MYIVDSSVQYSHVHSLSELGPAATSAPAAASGTVMLQRWLLFFSLMNLPLLASSFSSAASSPSQPSENCRELGALLWIRLWIKGALWLVCSIQIIETFSRSARRLFHFIIHVLTGGTRFVSFENFSFALTAWLTGARSLAWFSTRPPHWADSFLALI